MISRHNKFDDSDFSAQHSNISEEEMGSLHSIHYAENAVAAVRQRIYSGPSADFCSNCGDIIPIARHQAVPGCTTCVVCQSELER